MLLLIGTLCVFLPFRSWWAATTHRPQTPQVLLIVPPARQSGDVVLRTGTTPGAPHPPDVAFPT